MSSSFSGFSPSMPVPLGQVPSSVGSRVITTYPSESSVCAVTYSVAGATVSTTPFVPPPTVTPVETGHKRHRVEDREEWELMLAEFENLWASGKSFTPRLGPSFAPQLQLITLPVVVPATVLSVAPVAVAATSSAALSDLSWSAASSAHSYEWSCSHRSLKPHSTVHPSPGL